MKILAYGREDKEEVVVRIDTRQELNGVSIVAVDEFGKILPGGWLITITEDGMFRVGAVGSKIGFELDDAGRIRDITIE